MKMKLIILIATIIILSLAFYLYYENSFLSISKYEIKNKKIPKSFNNFKIAHISDFHNADIKKLNKDLVKILKKEQPDIIVITGDFIDARNTKPEVSLNLIKKIIKYAPIYYVPGNHEARIKEYAEFKNSLLESGVIILENKSEIITRKESVINLVGILDPAFNYKKEVSNKERINRNIKESKFESSNYTILLSHRPEYFKIYIENDVDLTLSGHAHGGQIRIPFIGGVVAPGQGLFPKYTSGVHEKDDSSLVISRGIGNSLFPFRINNRPELVIIKLNNN